MNRPNIVLTGTCTPEDYVSPRAYDKSKPFPRNRDVHAQKLMDELRRALDEDSEAKAAVASGRTGTYLEFRGPQDAELITKSLEYRPSGIRLLNVRKSNGTDAATVFIPKTKEGHFLRRLNAYADHGQDKDSGPRYSKLMSSIEEISRAVVESFWTGRPEKLPSEDKQWIEAWVLTKKVQANRSDTDLFLSKLDELGIEHGSEPLVFPERAVITIRANKSDLSNIVLNLDGLAEFRETSTPTSFFDDLPGDEQQEFVDDLLKRTTFEQGTSVICLLDSGVNRGNPLIAPALPPNAVISSIPSWTAADTYPGDGHGTRVAGIALYDDLKAKLESPGPLTINHRLESVKIYEQRNPIDDDKMFGKITEWGVDLAAANAFEPNRIFCTAIGAGDDELANGKPTSWSGAVDKIISRSDSQGETPELMLVAGGNLHPSSFGGSAPDYPDLNMISSVRSPGQAWNALTVGAFADSDVITTPSFLNAGYQPTAQCGDISPFSTTSASWDSPWPIKPEIVCAGGNTASDGTAHSDCPDLSRLSTGAQVATRPLARFNATSAAVAQAAWMAAELENAYPDLWPETIRGLLVHSARWTRQMREMLCKPGSGADKPSQGRKALLRSCGYGIPSLSRAIECRENSVNLIIQGELTPFQLVKSGKSSRPSMKEMHIHKIPWPKHVLQKLGAAPAELRVTLSYYVEPGPGEIGWKDKYRYASHGLRFDVNEPGESFEDFEHRVNVNARAEEESKSVSFSKNWFLGPRNRNVGSLHSDFKSQSAVELCETEFVAVYPVIGWWRTRQHLNRIDSVARYSLIVSIETPESSVDLYSEIVNQIGLATPGSPQPVASPV